jgi:hypothetical protein
MEKESILPCQGSIFISPRLPGLLCLDIGGLVVPVLEVFIHGSFLRVGVFLQHGHHAASLFRRGAMEDLVKLCITGVIFFLEGRKGDGCHVEKAIGQGGYLGGMNMKGVVGGAIG